MIDFVHLRVHSHYSFCQGASSVRELVDRAVHLGMRHLALTDKNGLYGSIKFYQEAKRRVLNPIIGADVDDPCDSARSATILAADRDGFADLCRLLTRRHLEDGFELARAICELGESCRVLTDHVDLLARLSEGGARKIVYGEINPRSLRGGGERARLMAAVTCQLGRPLVITGNVYFAEPDAYGLHLILKAIGARKFVHTLEPEETALPRQYLAPGKEMAELFREFPGALRETLQLAKACRLKLDIGNWKFPAIPLPKEESPFSCLWKLAVSGLARRCRPVTREAAKRLLTELEVIEDGGFSSYFLLVYDILSQAREWGLRHVGRGSAANSFVSYCLGFTSVDPLAHNLYFERFLNPARRSPPDIDLDFSWKERDRILEYVYRRYGEDRVAMISTHVTFGLRAAVRETARVMGLDPKEIGTITRRIPHWGPASLKDLQTLVPECRKLPLNEEPWAGIMATAEKMLGFPRHLSVHPGGIIVAPGPLNRWCPLERAPSGKVVTQYDMFGVEDMGLIKIDLLSQRSLGVLEDVLSDLSADGRRPDVENLPLVAADDGTRTLLREGKTIGCFYIESPAMRSLLKKLKTDTFEGLTAASSVIRPGVAESGMMATYIERHLHPEKTASIHPVLKEILEETYGVMIYQEDVMKVAHLVAGLTLAEADLLRRSMSGKMRSRSAMAELRDSFLKSSKKRGVAAPLALELWRQIESFAGYAFCKAHSASYAALSFQLAYLKAYYPAVFMAAVLSNGGGYYSSAAYLQECRRLGLAILPPDVNISQERYTADEGGVRVGLIAVKGLTAAGMDSLLESRRAEGKFSSLQDLSERTTLSRKELELLIRCGACDVFGLTRPQLLWCLVSLGSGASKRQHNPLIQGGSRIPVPPLKDFTLRENCSAEIRILGFSVAVHPLELFCGLFPRDVVSSADMGKNCGRTVRMVGWPIAYKRVRTKDQKVMKFLSLEDLAGTFEAVLFPEAYSRCAHLSVCPGPFLIKGRIGEEHGVFTLLADRLELLRLPDDLIEPVQTDRFISIPSPLLGELT